MNSQFSNPTAIAEAGEKIYASIRDDLEATDRGKFVAINIESKAYHLGDSPEDALERARTAEPQGIFHLIRIGFPGAFRISHAIQKSAPHWLFQ